MSRYSRQYSKDGRTSWGCVAVMAFMLLAFFVAVALAEILLGQLPEGAGPDQRELYNSEFPVAIALCFLTIVVLSAVATVVVASFMEGLRGGKRRRH